MSITIEKNDVALQMTQAMKENDEAKVTAAWDKFQRAVADEVKADFEELKASNDKSILSQRGYRQLTVEETKFYQKLAETGKQKNWKQAFTDLIDIDHGMPTTIIEDVYKGLVEEHPLLKKINFQYVSYMTKWLLNDHTVQTAVWGEITAEITKEITSAFRTEDIDQNKLSAFAVIEKGMLDLGSTFLDNYIRTILKEALYVGMETAIISGAGMNCPIGLDRDIHEGVTVSTTAGYPQKTPVAVTEFTPKAYGELIAKMAVTERGKKRNFGSVTMIVNLTDYLTKVMPATTVMTVNAEYKSNLFPFPTDVVISNYIEDGQAILFIPQEYFLGCGGPKDGVIEATDEYRFLEDQRVYKIKQYAHGKAYDNTTSLLLDISNLQEAYIAVVDKTPTA